MIKPNNNKLAIGERTYALRLEPWMPARQIAWLRRRTMAVVLMPAGGANGQSSVTIPLWLAPDMITTKLSPGG
jgi:hypothetical protein